ncbi:MAG: hypothetical protein Q7J85_11740 [Bacillota bacterium]|nr:hypothetical protein [Bacillota bacterium]
MIIDKETHIIVMSRNRKLQLEKFSGIVEIELLSSNKIEKFYPNSAENCSYLKLGRNNGEVFLFAFSKTARGIWKIRQEPFDVLDYRG